MRPIITHVMFLLTMGLVFLLVKLCLNIYATQTELKFPPDLPKFQKSIFIVVCCWMPVTCKWPDIEQLISFSDADNPKYKAKLTQLKCSLRYSGLCQEKWTLFISITPERSKSEAKLQKRWIRLKKVRGEKKMVLYENGGKIYIGCIQVMVDTKHIIQRNCCI